MLKDNERLVSEIQRKWCLENLPNSKISIRKFTNEIVVQNNRFGFITKKAWVGSFGPSDETLFLIRWGNDLVKYRPATIQEIAAGKEL